MRRRTFLATSSLGAVALATPAESRTLAVAGAGDERDIPRYAQDAWYDQLPGKHRLFVDSTTIPEAANALGFAWNFLHSSQAGYNLKDSDQAVVVCLRHFSTELAFSNDVWSRYEALGREKYAHPETGKHVKGTNVFRVGARRGAETVDTVTLDALAARGVHFAVCGLATRALAGRLAGQGASRDRVGQVMDELVKSVPATAHVMASGVLAAQRAGEYGYTILKG